MPTLYLMRHAQSVANVHHILAGREDFPLTTVGKLDAMSIAQKFAKLHCPQRIICSPLLRARQTATPFTSELGLNIELDSRLTEQNLGRFSGMTYRQAEADISYEKERSKRWSWEPDCGGESYAQIADRVQLFLDEIATSTEDVLVITHAVTLRLFRACLEKTLPLYPEEIAANGEVWLTHLNQHRNSSVIRILDFGRCRKHPI